MKAIPYVVINGIREIPPWAKEFEADFIHIRLKNKEIGWGIYTHTARFDNRLGLECDVLVAVS